MKCPSRWRKTSEQAEQHQEAARLFQSLAKTGGKRWNTLARMRLAEIALAAGRPKEALAYGQELLQTPTVEELPGLLRLMGPRLPTTRRPASSGLLFCGTTPG